MSKMQQVSIRELGREYSKPLNGELPNPGPEGMIAQPEEPLFPRVGTVWYNTTNRRTYAYYQNPFDGSQDWVVIGGSASGR